MKPFSTIAAAMLFAALPVLAQDTTGTWTPSMQPEVTTEINVISPLGKNKPLNCKRNVIPVKFSVTNTTEELVLVSNTADTDTTNDFSTLSFDPESTLTVADLTNLTAVYDVTAGNCGGGSLRWEIDTTAGNVFVYYGAYPNFDDCNDAATSQSGVNLLTLDDARVDSSQVLAGSQYNTWDAWMHSSRSSESSQSKPFVSYRMAAGRSPTAFSRSRFLRRPSTTTPSTVPRTRKRSAIFPLPRSGSPMPMENRWKCSRSRRATTTPCSPSTTAASITSTS
jgi:hypothetical protein